LARSLLRASSRLAIARRRSGHGPDRASARLIIASQKTARHCGHASLVAQNRHNGSAPLAQNRHGSSITVGLAVFCERPHASRSIAEDPAAAPTVRQLGLLLPRRRLRGIAVTLHWWRRTGMPVLRHRFYHSLARSLLRASSRLAIDRRRFGRGPDRASARLIVSPCLSVSLR